MWIAPGFVEGGIKRGLTLARLEAPPDANVSAVAQNGRKNPSVGPQLALIVEAGMTLDFRTPNGRVSAFLDYFNTTASWNGLHYGVNLVECHANVPLLDLPTVVDMPLLLPTATKVVRSPRARVYRWSRAPPIWAGALRGCD